MSMTDPVADMLTRIRNGYSAKLHDVPMPASHIKEGIAAILKQEGYIESFEVTGTDFRKTLSVRLNYGTSKRAALSGIKRISKPGLRVYAGKDSLPRVLGGLGIAILSTSKGLMTNKRAGKEQVGGEVLCYVW